MMIYTDAVADVLRAFSVSFADVDAVVNALRAAADFYSDGDAVDADIVTNA